MLVDSGSSTSFIKQTLAQQLEGVQPLPCIYKVRVVDEGELTCSSSIPRYTWYSQDHEFTTDMKVLMLGTYDAILGMDWLEAHSPMQVDWCAKCLEFSTPEGTICLHGHDSNSSTCFMINSLQLQSLYKQQVVSHVMQVCAVSEEAEDATLVPEVIQQVVATYPDVFGEPTGLPPRRHYDHLIPLIPRAQPVNIRLYRHKPDNKDEIEAQIIEILKAGIIHRSSSPFSSPMILVKKKDGTW